jgi:hypothetical protein
MATISTPQAPAVPVARKLPKPRLPFSFRGRWLSLFAITIFLFFYLPIIILIIYSFNSNQIVGVWENFSTRW